VLTIYFGDIYTLHSSYEKYVVFSDNNADNYETVEYHAQSDSFFLSSNCLSTASERAWRKVVIV